jgi:EAL domain-containing protein (putative c-di-GMP-specific phosphodiesterase class I)
MDLCRNLGLECVVEGVETESQCEMLTALGCRVMQGYLFGKPMPAEALQFFQANVV